jgi:EAL domain-containing protein (putative c-di-GMP-specific phosphodiesterase class I)
VDMVGNTSPVVLMVDNDEHLLAAVRRALSGCFDFVTFTNAEQALEWLGENAGRVELIIADMVATRRGDCFLQRAARNAPNVPRILLAANMSGMSLRDAISQAMVTRVLAKPVSVSVLKDAIDRVMRLKKPVRKADSKLTALAVNAALDRGDFRPVLQPRFRANDLCLSGSEILCRMPMLEKDYSIEEIFASCHNHPVINRLTSQMMTVMINMAPRYHDLMGDAAYIGLNLSVYSLKHPEFLEQIIRFYERMRMRGVVVSFEIPERQISVNDHDLIANARRLRERGIALFIDDFGSGNNSLDLLRDEAFAGVKLDRDLVAGVTTDLLDDAFVEWIARVCSKLGLSLSAKGIKNRDLANRLQIHGVTEMQGFYLGAPVPLEEWEAAAQIALSDCG